MKNIIVLTSVVFGLMFTSCQKFVDVGTPTTQLVQSVVFENDATATSAMLAIYAKMEANGIFYLMSQYSGLSSDELYNYGTNSYYIDIYTNNLTSENGVVLGLWTLLYDYNYQANAVIAGLNNSVGISAPIKSRLLGEAYFVRALCHHYLTHFFGEIPLVLSTEYRQNAVLSRKAIDEVNEQIANDLNLAINLLDEQYVSGDNTPTTTRVRPNKFAAIALLARVELERQNWALAEQLSTEVINETGLYALSSNLLTTFNKNNMESIWQVMPVVAGKNSFYAAYILLGAPYSVSMTDTLINSFEPGDNRRLHWVGEIVVGSQKYYFPYKYKARNNMPLTENTIVLRLAEQFLIRAEARAKQNNLEGANQDLNVIRARAGLSPIDITDVDEFWLAISKERKTELFNENDFRWADLRRMALTDEILGPIKFPNLQPEDKLYPIPLSEINKNPNLTQNPGY